MQDQEVFEQGREAYRLGRFFDAHERFEELWRQASDPALKAALQGLTQLAASLHKASRAESRGHAKLWAKAVSNLGEAAPRCPVLFGLDLRALVAELPTEAQEVDARPDLDRRRPTFGVVYLHGFGSSPDSPKGVAIASALREVGVPLVAPQLAEPDEFFDFTVSRSLGRARHALFERTLLVGSSLGGWTGALLAHADQRICQLVLLCPAFHFSERWFGPDRQAETQRWRREGWLEFEVGHPPEKRPLGVGFLEDAVGHDGAVQAEVPTLVFHGRRDEVVPLLDVERALATNERAELRVVDDDHSLRAHLDEVAALVVERALGLQTVEDSPARGR